MRRSAVVTLLAVPALALTTTAYAASPTTLFAEVTKHGPKGTTISLTEGTTSAGALHVTQCANTSPTAFVCKGTGTVVVDGISYGPATVRVRWKCPVDKACARTAEGTLMNHSSTLVLLHVKAGVPAFQKRGASFGVVVEALGE